MSKASGHAAGSRRVFFRYAGHAGDVVTLHGSFNGWSEPYRQFHAESGKEDHFVCLCVLRPGRYEYKYQVNGQWVLDETNPSVVANPFGSLNNLLEVSAAAKDSGKSGH